MRAAIGARGDGAHVRRRQHRRRVQRAGFRGALVRHERGEGCEVHGRDGDVACAVDDTVVNPAAPSVWAMTPKSTPENPTKDEPRMYCLSRGRARAEKMPRSATRARSDLTPS